jgi:very-short-patch-repair endonuclease
VDFYCPKKNIIIEIDGSQHNEDKKIEQDIERTQYFNNLGMKVFRVWNNEIVENLDGVIEGLLKYLGQNK